eukprot:4422682-Amphidinium_carterae.2
MLAALGHGARVSCTSIGLPFAGCSSPGTKRQNKGFSSTAPPHLLMTPVSGVSFLFSSPTVSRMARQSFYAVLHHNLDLVGLIPRTWPAVLSAVSPQRGCPSSGTHSPWWPAVLDAPSPTAGGCTSCGIPTPWCPAALKAPSPTGGGCPSCSVPVSSKGGVHPVKGHLHWHSPCI